METTINPQGYHIIGDGCGNWVGLSRLVAVAEYGFDAVGPKVDIHHKNGILCDNSRENLEPIAKDKHAHKHQEIEYGKRAYRDEDVLRELYTNRRMTLHEVADELDCSHESVRNWLLNHGIARRDWSEKNPDSGYKDADTLRRLYVEDGLSTRDLADRFGVSKTTIVRNLRKHDIKVRPPNR